MGRIHFLLIEVLPPALLITLLLWIKFHGSRQTFMGYTCFAVYLSAVYALVGLPTVLFLRFDLDLSLIPFAGMLDDLKNTILNILLFVPLGFLLPLLWERYRSRKRTLMFGLGMTLVIELLQIFTYRATDINDIITNTLGTFLGFLAFRLLSRKMSLPDTSPQKDVFCLLGVSAAVMFFAQPLISSAIWKYIL